MAVISPGCGVGMDSGRLGLLWLACESRGRGVAGIGSLRVAAKET